jgi:hypothetical protein
VRPRQREGDEARARVEGDAGQLTAPQVDGGPAGAPVQVDLPADAGVEGDGDRGIAPAVMAIITIAAYKLVRLTDGKDWRAWAVSVVVFAVTGWLVPVGMVAYNFLYAGWWQARGGAYR